MSPGQWIDYVESKKYEDISVVQSIEGEIQYRTHLALETQVLCWRHMYCTEDLESYLHIK